MCEGSKVYLEDDSERIELTWEGASSMSTFDWISGCCLAVKGVELEDGRFVVQDVCFPELAPRSPKLSTSSDCSTLPLRGYIKLADCASRCVAVVSGLNFGPSDETGAIDLLMDFLSGNMPNVSMEHLAGVVLAGSVLAPTARGAEGGGGGKVPRPRWVQSCMINRGHCQLEAWR